MSEGTEVKPERPLTNDQKVAVLLASLKESAAADILQRLDPAVLSRAAEAIRRLGVVPGEIRQRVVTECLHGIYDARDAVHGNDQTATNLLTQAIGEKKASALLQSRSESRTAFANLSGMSAEQLVSVLGREQPGIIAMVLRYLEPEFAAQVLNLIPREIGKRVMVILCTGRPPSAAVVERAETYLESKLGNRQQTERTSDGDFIDLASSILQSVDHALSEDVLQAIDAQQPDLGTELRDRLFSFGDIVRLSDADMRRIMQELDISALSVALRSASIDVRQKFFTNMSRRAVDGLKEEMEYAPKMKLADVEAKQKEVIAIIRDLDGKGEITIQESASNEYV